MSKCPICKNEPCVCQEHIHAKCQKEINDLRIQLHHAVKARDYVLELFRSIGFDKAAPIEQVARTAVAELAFLEWLLANCKIIHCPGGGHYPIEHAPAAKKDAVWLLKMAMNKEGMYAGPTKNPR